MIIRFRIAQVASSSMCSGLVDRYFSLGFAIFYANWNDSVKSRNLRRDPRVSAGIVAPLVGQASSRGARLVAPGRGPALALG